MDSDNAGEDLLKKIAQPFPKTRTYRNEYSRKCRYCRKQFKTWHKGGLYCSVRCRSNCAADKRAESPGSDWLNTPVQCGKCGAQFFRSRRSSPIRRYCSPECQRLARSDYYTTWKANNQGSQSEYNKTRGRDTLLIRVIKKYPELPRSCQAKGCRENRVIELAHRPEFKRNGRWRTIDLYQPHMIWILCPTCHRVLDFGIQTPQQLGLIPEPITPSHSPNPVIQEVLQ